MNEKKTIVVNIKTYRGKYVYIGRGSLFGNPFKIGKDGTRAEVLDKYIQYFIHRIQTDEYFKNAVLSLAGCCLGCFCKPDACHGDVICEFLNNTISV